MYSTRLGDEERTSDVHRLFIPIRVPSIPSYVQAFFFFEFDLFDYVVWQTSLYIGEIDSVKMILTIDIVT